MMNNFTPRVRAARAVTNAVDVVRHAATNSRGRTIVRDPRKATKRRPTSTALKEIGDEKRAPAKQPFQPFLQAPRQSFGSSMMQSMTWGAGMVLAFTAVGMFFR